MMDYKKHPKYRIVFNVAAGAILWMGVSACSGGNRWWGGQEKGSDSTHTEISLQNRSLDPMPTAESVLAATVSTETLDASTEGLMPSSMAHGPMYTFLDSVALNIKYKAIFGATNPRGLTSYQWSLTNPDLFFRDERAKLGTFNLRSNDADEQNSLWMDGLTQDYIAVIRKTLAGSCNKLVNAEYIDGNVSDNKIVKSISFQAPGVEAVNDIFNMFLGYSLPNGILHDGADTYNSIFEQNIADFNAANPTAAGSAKGTFLKKQYLLLCMSIGQDFRALMR